MELKNYRFTKEHEWVCMVSENKGKIGITDYAQHQLGDIVYVDIKPAGSTIQQFEKIGEVESVKAVSDIYAPVSGQVSEINQVIVDEPQLVNQDCYGAGWLTSLTLSNPSELDKLMTSDEYSTYVSGLA